MKTVDAIDSTETNPATTEVDDEVNEAEWIANYQPRTPLGRLLKELRAQIIASGQPLLTLEEIQQEVADRRGGYRHEE
jgi:hypothetical protein